ncbi:hypothetical protein KKJ04_10435 [Xenorhabdus bovienii]|uniref:hypothetical protein n=1 Tax=Xenorhabdus bovienii TaxID=40576 RepID=UPI0023B21EFD|nr:hypothetical protein [Xenorhabdus bovienii]MDE9446014.1 hypothetical protein [Xenorhabdus bovienii]
MTKLKLSAIVNIKQSHLLTPDDVAYFGLVNPKCRVNNKNRLITLCNAVTEGIVCLIFKLNNNQALYFFAILNRVTAVLPFLLTAFLQNTFP